MGNTLLDEIFKYQMNLVYDPIADTYTMIINDQRGNRIEKYFTRKLMLLESKTNISFERGKENE